MMSVGHVLDHMLDHMIIGLVTTALQKSNIFQIIRKIIIDIVQVMILEKNTDNTL